ncbi:hypothetical protein STAQ_40260 [Allostella sp. ATCC 35155]|nr:hypothetical protein STAQ_40260 [Stella sp. ATCC 35155]
MAATTVESVRPAFAVRRVVVALDAQCDHVAAIETACEFAGRWHCTVAGIFVVGSDLVNLGGLPGIRQICLASGGALSGTDLEGDIAAIERRARRVLADAARRIGAETSFAVARGGIDETTGLSADDLLIVEATVRPFAGGFALESRWRRVAEAARHPVLLRRRRSARPGPVAGFYDGSPAAERALAAALHLAEERDQPLLLVLAAELDEGAEAAIAPALEGRRPPARMIRAAAGDAGWGRVAAGPKPALLVVPAEMPTARWAGVPDADVLLLR